MVTRVFKVGSARGRMTKIRFTPLMQRRLTRRAFEMIQLSLEFFPELAEASITVGCTRKHLGSATVTYRKGQLAGLVIRLRVRKLSYQTIGHELTHLVQGLAYGDRREQRADDRERIPSGEKQCDIWTLARDPLFCDDPPTYIKLPRAMRERWPDYAEEVRNLCITAIAKRHTERQYIRWLEKEIPKLTCAGVRRKSPQGQLELAF
jgi:hypothetical protein